MLCWIGFGLGGRFLILGWYKTEFCQFAFLGGLVDLWWVFLIWLVLVV